MSTLEEEGALVADGFEGALIGLVEDMGRTRALYDLEECEKILVKRDGMTPQDAAEYLDFNVLGAYVGPQTPAFCRVVRSNALQRRITELESEIITLKSQRREP